MNLVWLSRMMSSVLVLLKLVTLTGVFVTYKVVSSVCFCNEKQTTLTASSSFWRIQLKYFLSDDLAFFTGNVPCIWQSNVVPAGDSIDNINTVY